MSNQKQAVSGLDSFNINGLPIAENAFKALVARGDVNEAHVWNFFPEMLDHVLKKDSTSDSPKHSPKYTTLKTGVSVLQDRINLSGIKLLVRQTKTKSHEEKIEMVGIVEKYVAEVDSQLKQNDYGFSELSLKEMGSFLDKQKQSPGLLSGLLSCFGLRGKGASVSK